MKIDFEKGDGLVPAIVQDFRTGTVLMLGYMNKEALSKTQNDRIVTFYSRSKARLWTKGESSGNKLIVHDLIADCDSDTILIKAEPTGPICHTGSDTCFGEKNRSSGEFLLLLQEIIRERKESLSPDSYTTKLFRSGLGRIAQKVGEEAVETVIASLDREKGAVVSEAADLIFHLMVLLVEKGISLEDVVSELQSRHNG